MLPKGLSKMGTYLILLVSCVINCSILWNNKVYAQSKNSYNLVDFGAVGDGIKDDSQALVKAWEAICGSNVPNVNLQIPKGKSFMVEPMTFQGPCKSNKINIEILGEIVGPNALSDYPKPTPDSWLKFIKVNGLTMNGGGTIDGRGQVWWNTCKGNDCPRRPSSIRFQSCNGLTLESLRFLNSSGNHMSIMGCNNTLISRLQIKAPENSINTDGIDISFSSGIVIQDCDIGTGDDCVAISNESHDIKINNVHCGPGHGISIGSLGKGGGEDTVQNVLVSNCSFKGTQNGARIKTWQGGLGFARNITYEDIRFDNASNPIIIDQFYCPQHKCANQTNAVRVSDIVFRRVIGTSSSEKAIVLHCSQSVGCTNIQFDQAQITSSIRGQKTQTDCFKANVITNKKFVNVPSLDNCHI